MYYRTNSILPLHLARGSRVKKRKHHIFRIVRIILYLILFFAFLYTIIYISFAGNGFIPTGVLLDKSDWLSFLGSYLSFAATTIISGIAIFQTYYYTNLSKKESIEKRTKEIQPIFSITIEAMNTAPAGIAISFNPSNLGSLHKHKNFTLKIENVSLYPIKHVIIFDKYIVQLLKSNESYTLQGAYEDSADHSYQSSNLLRILQSEYARSQEGLPRFFNICYEDVDGNDMIQSFRLNTFDGINYYELDKIFDA